MKEVVTDTREIKQLLKIIVKKKIFKGAEIPEPSNRFFPRISMICNHIAQTKRKLCHSTIDQDCLQEKINNRSCQINPVTYFLNLKPLFTTMKLLKRVSKMTVILRSTMIFDQEKWKQHNSFLFIKIGCKRDCLHDNVTS